MFICSIYLKTDLHRTLHNYTITRVHSYYVQFLVQSSMQLHTLLSDISYMLNMWTLNTHARQTVSCSNTLKLYSVQCTSPVQEKPDSAQKYVSMLFKMCSEASFASLLCSAWWQIVSWSRMINWAPHYTALVFCWTAELIVLGSWSLSEHCPSSISGSSSTYW